MKFLCLCLVCLIVVHWKLVGSSNDDSVFSNISSVLPREIVFASYWYRA